MRSHFGDVIRGYIIGFYMRNRQLSTSAYDPEQANDSKEAQYTVLSDLATKFAKSLEQKNLIISTPQERLKYLITMISISDMGSSRVRSGDGVGLLIWRKFLYLQAMGCVGTPKYRKDLFLDLANDLARSSEYDSMIDILNRFIRETDNSTNCVSQDERNEHLVKQIKGYLNNSRNKDIDFTNNLVLNSQYLSELEENLSQFAEVKTRSGRHSKEVSIERTKRILANFELYGAFDEDDSISHSSIPITENLMHSGAVRFYKENYVEKQLSKIGDSLYPPPPGSWRVNSLDGSCLEVDIDAMSRVELSDPEESHQVALEEHGYHDDHGDEGEEYYVQEEEDEEVAEGESDEDDGDSEDDSNSSVDVEEIFTIEDFLDELENPENYIDENGNSLNLNTIMGDYEDD